MTDQSGGSSGPSPEGFIERALIEAHHLANLTGVEEARLARRRLVDAQSAKSDTKTRDNLQEAVEYLELARLSRRDAATGFAKARRLALSAETELAHEEGVANFSIERLFREEPTTRRSLEDLRRDAAVNSYEQLRYDVALDQLFTEVRRQANDAVEDPLDEQVSSVEEALALADRELERARHDSDGGFEFLSSENLVPAEE